MPIVAARQANCIVPMHTIFDQTLVAPTQGPTVIVASAAT